RLPIEAGLTAYLYAWVENQVAAAIKSVPLGQVAGQRILLHLRAQLPGVVSTALTCSRAEPPVLTTFAPHYAIISSRHETQFSRLFRS
ncbi:MAG: urease accessory UreF family protein, partial [Pseudomonas sp.]